MECSILYNIRDLFLFKQNLLWFQKYKNYLLTQHARVYKLNIIYSIDLVNIYCVHITWMSIAYCFTISDRGYKLRCITQIFDKVSYIDVIRSFCRSVVLRPSLLSGYIPFVSAMKCYIDKTRVILYITTWHNICKTYICLVNLFYEA